MKVRNWTKKLAGALVAGGLAVTTAHAAPLDTNLVVDPGFEDVNATTGAYGSLQLNSWRAGTKIGFTYASGQYDNGGPLAGGGARYFTSNGTSNGDATGPGQISQLIDVSTGPSGTQIAAGTAAFSMSAFFTTYLGDNDFGFLHVDFLNSSSVSLGTNVIGPGANVQTWTQLSGGGLVPVGTATFQVSVYGGGTSSGHDGYVDNVDIRLVDIETILMFAEVNTSTGEVSIRNNTGDTINIDYYELLSDNGNGTSLLAGNGNWNSLQDQNLAGFPAGNGSGNGWEEAGGSDSGVLSESYLTGNSAVVTGANISLGNAFNTSGAQNLTFRYGVVTGDTVLTADYNGDGVVDAADYTVWRDTEGMTVTAGTGADGSGNGTIDDADYDLWRGEFGLTGGPSGTSTLVTGFVRYVGAGSLQPGAVPEPSTIVLASLAFTGLVVAGRRK